MRQAFIFLSGAFASMVTAPLVVPESRDLSSAAFSAREAAVQPARMAAGTGSMRADDGLFYIDGTLKDGSIRFLVDTGASHVVLSHRDARRVGPYVTTNDKSAVLTAGGPVAVDWIIIKEINFDGHIVKNLKAAVPRRDVGISLLGQNALAQFDSIRIDGDTLTLSH
ncbi:MAG: clan AA aspartic protease [Sphingomonadales bacterium]|nr:clan AA aspartic protease [Sphingomonadales bacterium]